MNPRTWGFLIVFSLASGNPDESTVNLVRAASVSREELGACSGETIFWKLYGAMIMPGQYPHGGLLHPVAKTEDRG